MLEDIKGVGPKTLKLLNKLGIYTLDDLIDYYPYRYNTITPTPLENGDVVIVGIVESPPITTYIRKSLNKLSFRIDTSEKLVNVTIFNRAFMKSNIKRGSIVTIEGEYDERKNTIVASNIYFKEIEDTEIQPVYHVTSGISSKLISNIVKNALLTHPQVNDFIPEYLALEYDFLNKTDAIYKIHNPIDLNSIDDAKERLKFEELFKFMFKINYLKVCRTEKGGLPREEAPKRVEEFIKTLPFELTADQKKAIDDILDDLKSPKRMNRLLLGDVGSGKTIAAVCAIYYNTLAGYQSALLVPTEILANQHFLNITNYFKDFGIRVELLKGKTTKKERTILLEDLKSGEIDVLIGTHAVLMDDVEFANLGLVVTDEQHRFGVNQRKVFQNKGTLSDVLYMSATPIPRTYALTIYGDMDISMIKTKPSGRKDIATKIVSTKEIKSVLARILEEVKEDHKVYVVCPLIEASEEESMMDVISMKKNLEKAFQNKVPIGLLHGQMKPNEKDAVMEDFKDGKVRILVSTTVIEVGVDVKEATLMIIMNAERFGLATIHQLRGRIGRNSLESECILVSDKKSKRLDILTESSDGFYISEQDFKLRGEGDLFGIRQSGDMVFKLANLNTDMKILSQANVDSAKFIKENMENSFEKYPEYKRIVEELSHID